MSINIGDKPEMNVVNVGDELTQDAINAINAATTPSATNPFLTRFNTFNTTTNAVEITQEGTGNCLVVRDQASPDTTPFVIDGSGRVGIGTANLSTHALSVVGTTLFTGNTAVSGNLTSSGANAFTVSAGSSVPLTIYNFGTGNSFVVSDQASDTTRFIVDSSGRVGVNTNETVLGLSGYQFYVNGDSFIQGDFSFSGSITFPSSSLSSGTSIGAMTGDYPNELLIKVGSTTYRVPARIA